MKSEGIHTVVILGCRVTQDGDRRALVGALSRRVATGAALVREDPRLRVVVSGGRAWGGVVEADAMAEGLRRAGVPEDRIERERRSRSTRQNARFVRALVEARRIALVTCDWHLPRAVALFEEHGFEVEGVPAPSPRTRWSLWLWRWGRERVAAKLDRLDRMTLRLRSDG
jgi:uncharacterized SAM-binding protein YcdF (DUF218 family)